MTHLTLAYKVGHGADGLLDRRVRIDPMLIVEVDSPDPEPHEARFARLADIGRISAYRKESALRAAHGAEFCRQHDLVATAADRPSDQFFVAADPVHVRGVEERDAAIDGMLDRRDSLVFVAAGVELRHTHAAEP